MLQPIWNMQQWNQSNGSKKQHKESGANKKRKQEVEESVFDNSSDSHNLKDDMVLYCKSIILFYIMLLFTIFFWVS
jgi:hypothetical protein